MATAKQKKKRVNMKRLAQQANRIANKQAGRTYTGGRMVKTGGSGKKSSG